MKKENWNRNAGRKPMYGEHEPKLIGVLIRKDKEKEMRSDIEAVQDKYKKI